MITNGEFVSYIVNQLKAYTKDGHVSRRFILQTGQVKARFLMSQKLDELSLFREDGIISTIDCFKLRKIDAKECDIFEFRHSKNIMKSVNKLPEGLFGKTGAGIISVYNIDGSKEYDYISLNRYRSRDKLKYKRNDAAFYYVQDGYLILPDSTNELVEVRLFTLDEWEVNKKCDCCDKKDSQCKSNWDAKFICPDRFLDLVRRDTLQEIASVYRTSIEDENPNLDSNQKSQTTS